jgi:hypothetical protein
MATQISSQINLQMKSQFLKTFNDQFMQFVEDIISVFPEDPDLVLAKNAFVFFRKSNPKVIIDVWYRYVVQKYKQVIEDGDVIFFIEKDYSHDVSSAEYSDKIMEAINRLREPIKNMSTENQAKTIKYLQNLSKIALLVPL